MKSHHGNRWAAGLLGAALVAFSGMAPAAGGGARANDPGAPEGGHFHAKGKPPSASTSELQRDVRATLPFADRREFEEAARGFIAAPSYRRIMADAGNVAWDMASYDFLLHDKDYPSIHPSLQRQAVLNMAYGLYEVVPGRIYQVRGFDLANISFIKGDTGGSSSIR
jgi:alkyl sulfatase BDS1-like metallo-beta-lactamase superfamily hydrolase